MPLSIKYNHQSAYRFQKLLRHPVFAPDIIEPAFQVERVAVERPGIDKKLQQGIENESRTGGIDTSPEIPGGSAITKYLSYTSNVIIDGIDRFSVELPVSLTDNLGKHLKKDPSPFHDIGQVPPD